MIEILHSPPHFTSPSNIHSLSQHNSNSNSIINCTTCSYRRNNCTEQGDGVLSGLSVLVNVLRKSLVGCKSITITSGVVVEDQEEKQIMEIGCPTNVRHVAHVTFDRFNGFLGLPVEFEPEVPRRPPSASTRVFGVSTESMQLSFDCRGNCVPTILLMMQRRLYSQAGLEAEGIFRINPGNGQEEYVREQLNNGLIPDDIDVHCLAGLIKAWFRELPTGILDCLSPEDVMQAQSEDECTHLVRLLPPTEAALLDWAVNLMADVAQFEHLNKMNVRNIAMVFAPNMTQMSDPLTALVYAVQVMNFLKTLIAKILREREDSVVESDTTMQLEPSDDDCHHSVSKQENMEENEIHAQEESNSKTENKTHCFLSSIENILSDGKAHLADNLNSVTNMSVESGKTDPKVRRTKTNQPRNSSNVKKGSKGHTPTEKNKEISTLRRVNSYTERVEAWR